MPSQGFEALKTFFESAPAARKAAKPLGKDAEVALILGEGERARFTMASGAPRVLAEPAVNPDFTLTLPEGAVKHITGLRSDDVGEFGVEFFKLVLAKDPTEKVHVHIDAPTSRLLGHGYLGVLALGGVKVTWWLIKNGAKNPKAAIERLRGAKPQ